MSYTSTRRGMRPTAWLGLTVLILLAVPYLLTGLLAPFWTAVGLWTVWTVLLVVAVHNRYRHAGVVALVPAVGAVIWVLAIWFF